jgi:GNAT superfamily N-acetyltransferase
MDCTVSYLADHPQYVTQLAPWLHAEWGWFTPGSTLEDRIAKLHAHRNRDELPLAVVAELQGGLASVYVAPWARRAGVGTRLVVRIEAEARRLGFAVLHLVTFDQAAFYARRGWHAIECVTYRGELVTVMRRPLERA